MVERALIVDPGTMPVSVAGPPVANFSLRDALSAVFRRKFRLLLAFLLPPVIAITLIFVQTPIYRAQTSLMVKTGPEYLPEDALSGAQGGPTSKKIEEINSEIALLQDRAVAEDTINRIGIENLYPGVLKPSVLSRLPAQGSAMDAAVKRFYESLHVSLVKMSNVLGISFDYKNNRAMASKVLDTYIAAYLRRRAEVYASDRASTFQTAIDQDAAELRGLEQDQARIKLANGIYDIVQQRIALITQRVDAETHLQETMDRKETLERRVAYLSGIRSRIPATLTSTEAAPNEEVVQANETLTTLQQNESALLARYSPDNPDVRRVQGQIAAIQRRIGQLKASSVRVSKVPGQLPQQVEQELVMDRAELTPLADEMTRYQSLIKSYDVELQRLEKADTDLRVIQLRIANMTDNLKSIRGQYDIARTRDEMNRQRLSSVVQVAPAMTPLKPVEPKPLLYAAGGLLLGILAAGALAVWTMMTNSVFYAAEGVEVLTGLPVLATVPLLRQSRKRPLFLAPPEKREALSGP